MTVVVVQPALFPWIGAFEKLRLASTWIHLDHVSFQRAGFLHRIKLRDRQGSIRWLTTPIGRPHLGTPICEVRLPPDGEWRLEHLRKFDSYYRTAPFASEARQLLERVYERVVGSAVDLAIASIETTVDLLGVPQPTFVRSSSLCVASTRSELIADLVEEVAGTSYLFGPGSNPLAGHYLDRELLRNRGISVEIMEYRDAYYSQCGPGFVSRLSVLDAIASLGIAKARDLIFPQPVGA